MMITGLISLATLGFVVATLNLYKAKPRNQRQAEKLVLFFGYASLAFLIVLPYVAPVGGAV